VKIIFTDRAIEQLTPILTETKRMLKLKYDTDDCGCLINGVIALSLVDEADDDDMAVDTNFVPVFVEKSRLVFYDDTMTIDIVEGGGCFQLKSPGQILSPRMPLVKVSEPCER